MTFEEKFPELKNKLSTFEGNFGEPVGEGYLKEDVEEHCLSKSWVLDRFGKMLLVLEALTPKNTEGDKVLQEWKEEYKRLEK